MEYHMKKWFILPITIVCLYGFIASLIDGYGQKKPSSSNFDAIVVAGCKVRQDGSPSLALQARVRKAVSLYKEGYASKIILTGGSPDGRLTEAQSAKLYAKTLYDIPDEAILLEEKSTTTESNASFTKSLYPHINKIILVSDSYHIFRGERIFQRYFSHVEGTGRIPKWNVRIKGALREVPAIIYYKWKGAI
jgi:uncharacterized SAM-binding protein YcdF (DUF218 family)